MSYMASIELSFKIINLKVMHLTYDSNIYRPNEVQNMSCFFHEISKWNSQFQITVGYIGKISSN